MSLLVIFLTLVLVLDCMLLTLLVLMQLPKKDAGMGQAFGGAATDALFGAGSGNALTKMTKYATAIFLILTLALAVINNHQARKSGILFDQFQKQASAPDAAAQTPAPGSTAPVADPALKLTNIPQATPVTATNAPAAPATNVATNAARPPAGTPAK